MDEKSESSSFKLLQPELMTVEELCEILRACCVKHDLTSYNKNELVELFKRVALPLPQREYSSSNWRERLLSKGQKRKVSSAAERENVKRICSTNGSTKVLANNSNNIEQANKNTSSSRTQNTSRLKPPINLNYTKKVLKLALPNSKTSDGSSSRKKIVNEKTEIKSQEKTTSLPSKKIIFKDEGNEITSSEEKSSKSTPQSNSNEKQPVSNGKHKRIVIDFSDSSTTTTKTPKVVNLKRSNSEISNSGQKVRRVINT